MLTNIGTIHSGYHTNQIYKLTTKGKVADSFDSPDEDVGSLVWDGEHLWITSHYYTQGYNLEHNTKIYKMNTTGKVVDSIDVPYTSYHSLAWDGQYFWAIGEFQIYKLVIKDEVEVVGYFDDFGGATSLTWVGGRLWVGTSKEAVWEDYSVEAYKTHNIYSYNVKTVDEQECKFK